MTKRTAPQLIENLKTANAIDKAAEYSEAPDTLRKLIASLSIGFQCMGPKADAFNEGTDRGPMLHWRIHLTRKGAPYVFDFFGSINDCKTWQGASNVKGREQVREGMLYSVLCSIGCEYDTPTTFDDFCAEYGYDNDSRKAYNLWERCAIHAKQLRECLDLSDAERFALPS